MRALSIRFTFAAFGLAVGGYLSGCSLLLDTDALGGGVADAGAILDGSSPSHEGGNSSPADGGERGPDGGGNASECSGTAGPKLARVPSGESFFCIDTTEVTNADYARFLAAVPSPRADLTAGRPCAFKTSYEPGSWPPAASNDDVPVTEVDWCDAYAFCAWAGKRLCGRVGGGASSVDEIGSTSSQWYSTCSRAGANRYPYGASYDTLRCRPPLAQQAPVAVGTSTGCVGGYPGIFDMSGNVAEWEDACEPANGGSSDACAARGGSYVYEDITGAFQACDADRVLDRDTRAPNVGFRCCGP